MSYTFVDHEGLLIAYHNNEPFEPFVYIDARTAPPWWIEPVDRARVGPFDTLEAAKLAILLLCNKKEK
jgi:hypothetical protein